METMNPISRVAVAALAFATLGLLAGCNGAEEDGTPVRTGGLGRSRANRADRPKPVVAEAGIPVSAPAAPSVDQVAQLANRRPLGRRADAFALLGPETQFERAQLRERIATEAGGFAMEYQEPQPKPDEIFTLEPQPPRRLAGILLGNGVLAVIEMEDGKTYEIRPGTKIPNSEWTVVSIDEDKAILRRPGKKRPNRIEVKLSGKLNPGGGSGDQGGGDTTQGAPDAPGRPGSEGSRGGGGRLGGAAGG